jgi:uncharacterized protein
MQNQYFRVNDKEKEKIVEILGSVLKKNPEIIFSYLHGSFITETRFRDIDVAVYFGNLPSDPLQTELDLEVLLGNSLKKFPVEVRVLNHAPLSFRYNVIKYGQILFVIDDDLRSDFVQATLRDYFDFAPFRKTYLKEVLGSGI